MAKIVKRKAAAGDVATNRQASYRYNLLERFECGIVLTGTEVKSLREGKAQLKDAYADDPRRRGVADRRLHPPVRARLAREPRARARRKLLLHRREIERLIGQDARARTDPRADADVLRRAAVAAKVEIALARGKDIHDKRETIRKRDMARDVHRELASAGPVGLLRRARTRTSRRCRRSGARRARCRRRRPRAGCRGCTR